MTGGPECSKLKEYEGGGEPPPPPTYESTNRHTHSALRAPPLPQGKNQILHKDENFWSFWSLRCQDARPVPSAATAVSPSSERTPGLGAVSSPAGVATRRPGTPRPVEPAGEAARTVGRGRAGEAFTLTPAQPPLRSAFAGGQLVQAVDTPGRMSTAIPSTHVPGHKDVLERLTTIGRTPCVPWTPRPPRAK